jgi:HD-GYP domain-containing protein (c-di-GMP phosphodiesterase class II)
MPESDPTTGCLLERIDRLNAIGVALSAESDTVRLLDRILRSAKELTGADGGSLYLVRDEGYVAFEIMSTDSLGIEFGGRAGDPVPFDPVPLEIDGEPNRSLAVTSCVLRQVTINIPDIYAAGDAYDFSGTRAFDQRTGYRTRSLLTVPMRDHQGAVIGVLQLINALDDGQAVPFSSAAQQLAESLASQAAIALTNKRLLDNMRELFEAFVQIIAQAIDEKSPYTGAHCRRVPELTMMLADAADAVEAGPMASFHMDTSDRYALHLAGWLHDCGKVTTPEHVMDKSTKLEAVHDRIEEIAARFACARAETQAAYAEAIGYARAYGDTDQETVLTERRDSELASLDDDLAFLRRANMGGERTAEADRARVARIGERRWHDTSGHAQPMLTADEVTNFSVERGTLNAAEVAIMRDHVAASIRMLEQLPFPHHLAHVPEYAAYHHERVDGKGYPYGLTREQMPVPARVMAIADVFEALSAGDRPYKQAKRLSECLQIMGKMCEDGHIDPDLFDVFVDSGVYRQYAERFLRNDQRDEIDLSRLPGYRGVNGPRRSVPPSSG